MKKKRQVWKLAGATALGVLSVFSIGRMHSEWVLRRLTRQVEHSYNGFQPRNLRTVQQFVAWKKAARQQAYRFQSLRLASSQRDIANEVITHLHDPDAPALRLRAVKLLGRLETPKAEAPLEALDALSKEDEAELRKHPNTSKEWQSLPFGTHHTLHLALGRIRARNLRGRAKVEAVAKEVGLSWGEVVRLSYKVNDPVEGRYASSTPGYEIVDEIVDVLYTMGKRGENIGSFANTLTLREAQKIKLQGASLQLEQEVKLILDYLSLIDIERSGDADLGEHLVDLGPQAAELLLQRLGNMKKYPRQYPQHLGHIFLFRAAANFGDHRFLPLLRYFENSDNLVLRGDAVRTRERLEKQLELQGVVQGVKQQSTSSTNSPTRRRSLGLRRR